MNLSSVVNTLLNINDFAVVWHCRTKQYDKTVDNEFTVANKATHQCVGPKSEETSVFFKNLWITVINRSGKPAEIDAYIRNNNPLLSSRHACNITLHKCRAGDIPVEVNPSNKQSCSLEHHQRITLALCNDYTFKSECNNIRFTLEINGQVAYFYDFAFSKNDPAKNIKSKPFKQERLIKFHNTEIHNPYYLEYAVKRPPTNQEALNKSLTVIPQQPLAHTPITNSVETTVTTVVTTVRTVFNSNISNQENSTCGEENSSPLDSSTQDSSRKAKSSLIFHSYTPRLDLYNQDSSRKDKSSIAFHPYKRPLTQGHEKAI